MGILIHIQPEKEHHFRELAMKKFGFRKGALTLAIEEAIDAWIDQQSPVTGQENTKFSIHQIRKKIHGLLPILKKKYHVKKLGIFGSYVRDEQTPKSDLDILVEFEKNPSLLMFIELRDYLTDEIGIRVDLVTKNKLKPEIRDRVLEETIYA
jgi:predicted nucleotidyltransferase